MNEQAGGPEAGDPVAGVPADGRAVDVSIIMPCLNEIQSLPHCIANAKEAAHRIEVAYGLKSEIVIADNGSTDGSQAYATAQGARVVAVPRRGYGAALIGGCEGGHGRYLLMGDADGSYDFNDGVAMIGQLVEGADLCMGSRFAGGIAKGAMPWKNRYIGNPVLTGILNLFYRSGIDDAHCGIRAITKRAFEECALSSTGMEFASEMVIKASLRGLHIEQVPAKLQPDLRDRAPHLRPWRDGWRHLRYLLMLSPTWVFGVPAMIAMLAAVAILGVAMGFDMGWLAGNPVVGAGWTILAGFLLTVGHFAAIMAMATHFYGVRTGYRDLNNWFDRFSPILTLEHALVLGLGLMVFSGAALTVIGINWRAGGYLPLPSVLPLVVAAAAGAIGVQTALGGFLLAIIAGHDAAFVPGEEDL
ncbi:glycosyltransferase family 2 protein [Novosphingobium humi]|uniref:Glycosyltransferase family 2 protein n=1 Tax=Novosphingobium humi TaxID=2282397 RepID=A0ABY7TW71_9SPHN|nr:glycosyltransferase family 2 protein [Novosphingobium humi]WCT77491.1 glycosyltransferase family 2 protein [Novosphingobium humi]